MFGKVRVKWQVKLTDYQYSSVLRLNETESALIWSTAQRHRLHGVQHYFTGTKTARPERLVPWWRETSRAGSSHRNCFWSYRERSRCQRGLLWSSVCHQVYEVGQILQAWTAVCFRGEVLLPGSVDLKFFVFFYSKIHFWTFQWKKSVFQFNDAHL